MELKVMAKFLHALSSQLIAVYPAKEGEVMTEANSKNIIATWVTNQLEILQTHAAMIRPKIRQTGALSNCQKKRKERVKITQMRSSGRPLRQRGQRIEKTTFY